MKVAVLAGGLGSRLDPSGSGPPKALAPIGGEPVLWHLLRYYASYGVCDSVIALGYKASEIKEYFLSIGGQVTVEQGPALTLSLVAAPGAEPLTITLVETGDGTQNGGRIKRLAPYLGKGTFMLTWCDGLSDINLQDLLAFHRDHGRPATVTAVHPPSTFGHLDLAGDCVTTFVEKPEDHRNWINGAFFVLESAVLDEVEGDETQWERDTMVRLADEGSLMAYRHQGFWQCMDTALQNLYLNDLWARDAAPWKRWT